MEIFDRQSDVMINTLSQYSHDEPIDILSVVTLCALDVIGGKLMMILNSVGISCCLCLIVTMYNGLYIVQRI